MTVPLAIFCPNLGLKSETFIRRHIETLLPGGTVVITGMTGKGPGKEWIADCPVLDLSHLPRPRMRQQLLRAIPERLGWKYEDPESRAVRDFLVNYKVEVVLGEYLDVSLPWLRLCKSLGIRFWGHAHGYDVSVLLRRDHWRKAYLQYRDAAGIIVVSEVSRMRLVELGLNAEMVHVIPCCVTVENSFPEKNRHDGLIRCLAVGRMVSKKSPIFCLDSFRRAAESCPSLRLTYVGEGELLSAARHFVKAFDLESKVSLLGGQSHEVIAGLMAEADVFIQHSVIDQETGDEEGLPVAILEAMACGLPVVSTRHAGIPEAVIDGNTGFLVAEGDSKGMADCLIKLAGDHELRLRMGRAGWRRAKEMFTWERERDSLRKIMGLKVISIVT